MSEQSPAPDSESTVGERVNDGDQAEQGAAADAGAAADVETPADAGAPSDDGATAGAASAGSIAEASGSGDGAVGDGPRVVGLESTDAAEVISAVGSDTARTVLEALHEEPASASTVANRVDCSLQTVQYHLGNLAGAGLVEVVDTATSEKGREMDVYGPARRPVVVYAGDDDGVDLRGMLRRLVPVVALLSLASLLVQELFGGADGGPETGDTVAVSAEYASEAATATGPEPGVVFFAGGLVVLLAYLGWWQLRRRGVLDRLPSVT